MSPAKALPGLVAVLSLALVPVVSLASDDWANSNRSASVRLSVG